mmetsp:Transcript_58364/g.115836  ORF Transcript_58364/g.115836 Transcript_58364/m.115836 type:complete len:286 (-) Transcript_58364:1852-2709(-)
MFRTRGAPFSDTTRRTTTMYAFGHHRPTSHYSHNRVHAQGKVAHALSAPLKMSAAVGKQAVVADAPSPSCFRCSCRLTASLHATSPSSPVPVSPCRRNPNRLASHAPNTLHTHSLEAPPTPRSLAPLRGLHNLREVLVHVVVGGIALEVLTSNQILDALLDLLRVRLEVPQQLVGGLEHQLLVVECLACLHDADNSGLNGVFAVLIDGGLGGVLLLLGDFSGDHRHFDAASAVGEVRIVLERVGGLNLLGRGLLKQYLVLPNAERQRVPLQLVSRQVELLLDVVE